MSLEMSVEYGTDLQGSLLTVVHEICEHEREFGRGLARYMQWNAGSLALSPAHLNTANPGFKVLSATLSIEDGDMNLQVHNSSKRDIQNGDWYAEDFM